MTPRCPSRSRDARIVPGRPGRALRRLALLLALLASLPGCRVMVAGERSVAEENDRLRESNLRLQRQVDELTQQVELRRGEAAALREQLVREDDEPDPALAGAESPVLSKLAIGRHSGAVDSDGDGRDDLIRIYLRPLDQRGRLLPVAGRATLRAVDLAGEGEPATVAERAYEPAQFDAAWRSGMTGTHYTLELALPETLPAGEHELTVRVALLEARSGARFSTQQVVTVRHRDR